MSVTPNAMTRRAPFSPSSAGLVLFFILFISIACQSVLAGVPSEPRVVILTVKGIIAPFTAQYIVRGIDTAEREQANAVIIQMDTFGGLVSPMDDIVIRILNSQVPVVVYVSPPGARAGSAGVFIAMAAQVAAMAPNTDIGAAHPVSAGGENIQSNLRDKATDDAGARVRVMAQARGRNVALAESAVRQSVSITADQALQLHLIDFIATDLDDLLAKLDRLEISTNSGAWTFRTQGIKRERLAMSWSERFLHTLTDPNIAYILLNLGTIAVIAELYHPGVILPGAIGVICLVLAFIAFGVLEPNWVGVALIVLALILFLIDLKVPGYALTAGATVILVLGSILLYRPFTSVPLTLPAIAVSPWLIGIMTLTWVSVFVFWLSPVVRAQRVKLSTGVELLVGAIGVAKTDLKPGGIVVIHSKEWSAEAPNETIQRGDKVRVTDIEDGLRLLVTKVQS